LGTEGLGSLAWGGKSSEMLVVQEARLELVVNLKTAIALSVEIPASLRPRQSPAPAP